MTVLLPIPIHLELNIISQRPTELSTGGILALAEEFHMKELMHLQPPDTNTNLCESCCNAAPLIASKRQISVTTRKHYKLNSPESRCALAREYDSCIKCF